MNLTKETKWMCEHASALEKFSGKMVMFNVPEGVVSKGSTLDQVLHSAKKKKYDEQPFLFHVPSKDELQSPVPVIRTDHKHV